MTEWPALGQVNVWGMNPDGQPDQSGVYGDIDGDSILDRLPPSALSSVVVNITIVPPSPFLAWQFQLDDGTLKFELFPVGSRWNQMVLYFLLWLIPVITGGLGIWAFMKSFYQVKFNERGLSDGKSLIPLAIRRKFRRRDMMEIGDHPGGIEKSIKQNSDMLQPHTALAGSIGSSRRTVLIATM